EIPEAFEWTHGSEEPLTATPRRFSSFGADSHFVSASMLAVKAKLFDDGLYAAAELAGQPAKTKLLKSLAHVAPLVAAAARLGGADVPGSSGVDRITREFLDDEKASKPLAFYTWSDEL